MRASIETDRRMKTVIMLRRVVQLLLGIVLLAGVAFHVFMFASNAPIGGPSRSDTVDRIIATLFLTPLGVLAWEFFREVLAELRRRLLKHRRLSKSESRQ